MQALKLAWLGTRTGDFTATVELFRDVLGLELVHSEAGFAVLDLPDGGRVEVFGEHSAHNRHFTHPVAGFLVDDLEAATRELEHLVHSPQAILVATGVGDDLAIDVVDAEDHQTIVRIDQPPALPGS